MDRRGDPTMTSLRAAVVAFVVFLCALSYLSPDWVQVVDKNGRYSISISLLISYSLTFSLVVAIGTLIIVSPDVPKESTKNAKINISPSNGFAFSPDLMAAAFCSK